MRGTPTSPSSKRTGKLFVGYNWGTFKLLANLTKKSDQAITEYYNAFLTMCHRVCHEALPEGTFMLFLVLTIPGAVQAPDTLCHHTPSRDITWPLMCVRMRVEFAVPGGYARLARCALSSHNAG